MQRQTYAMLLAYDGGPYKGWQPHPVLPTVAGVLGAALHRAGVGATPFGASRTDAGVHARAQVASFSSRERLDLERLRWETNDRLPSTVRLLAVRPAPPSFHAHWSSCGKVYRFRLGHGGAPGRWRLPPVELDPTRLLQALGMIEAAPDVAALSATRGEEKTRRVTRAALLESGAEGSLIEVEAAGFGKYLVRNLMAAAAATAAGELSPDELLAALAGRAPHPRRAPAEGLCLWRVLYPAQLDPFPDVEELSRAAPPVIAGWRRG